MPLTTLNDIKTFLGIPLSNTAQDALIETFRPAVEELVINYCDTDFEQKSVAKEIHDGALNDVIVPYNFPIIEIEEVWIGTDTNGDGGTQLTTDQFYVDDDGSVILRDIQTPHARGCVKLKYKHGYAAVPATVKVCVYQAVKAEMQRHKRNTEDISSRSKEGESEGYNSAWDKKTGLPVQIMSKLDSYRAREFANSPMAQRNR